jgi:hypothetical protein
MVVKRRRQDTAQLREKAEVLPPGGAREQIMRRITQNQAASNLCEMLRSPVQQPPK